MPIISVKNLSKTYEYYKKKPGFLNSLKSLVRREKLYTEAVKNVSFEIKEGELVGFIGPNGAGKTTTLKILSGILYPTSGWARVLGYTPWERKKEYQKQFALVMGQKNQLWWDLPAMESFLLNKEIYEIEDSEFNQSLDELSEMLKVKKILNIPVRKLSLGQRMKCELIAALIHRPRVLFLDEPTIGLDVVSQKKLRDFILKYNQLKKTTILLTSHYMDDIEELAKRVIVINKGKIIFDGQLSDLVDRYVDFRILKIILKKPIIQEEAEKFGKIIKFNKDQVDIQVQRGQGPAIASEVLKVLPVDDLLIENVPIEDVIRKIFERGR